MSSGIHRDQGLLYGYLFFTVGILYFYLTHHSVQHFVDSWNEYYEGALLLPRMTFSFFPSISLLDFIGSIFVCKRYRQTSHGEKSWFEIVFACILMQFGGTLILGLLLGQVPSWILSRSAIPGFLLAWWLSFYSPDDFFWKYVSNNATLTFFLGILNAISSGHAVTSWGLDKAYWNAFHVNSSDFAKSYFVCILSGTIAASGGGILAEVFNFTSHSRSFTLRHKSKFFEIGNYSISATVNKSFWLATIYFLLISNPSEAFPISFNYPKVTGHSIIALLQIAAYLTWSHIPHLDIYQEFSNFILDVLNIPPTYSFSQATAAEVAADELDKND